MQAKLALAYPAVLDTFGSCAVPGRTESHAFLVWFLIHYFRLDDTEAVDAVCDGPDDKGIDGVYVDDNFETVYVFQCKLVQNSIRTLGDTKLKEFMGTLAQFQTADEIDDIAKTTSNPELAKLLESEAISEKVTNGYNVKGVFVMNIERDANAVAYLDERDEIQLFDKSEIEERYIPVGPTAPTGTPVEFDVFGYDCAEYKIADVKVLFAPIKGNDLIRLEGIASRALFAWNVREYLGRSKVNQDIGESIKGERSGPINVWVGILPE